MNIKEKLFSLHELLRTNHVDHMLIGGLGMGMLGVERFTNDIDFMIAASDVETIKLALFPLGYKPLHTSTDVLQFSGDIAVDFLLAHRPLALQMLRDAPILTGTKLKYASAEAMIALKIQAYSNNKKREFRDKADIQALIETGSKLDWALIKKYAEMFGEWHTIVEIRERVGKK